MPCQTPAERVKNFAEVALGYSEQTAMAEAARCLQCKRPTCVDGCPVEVDIPGFIARVAAGDFVGAAQRLKEKNLLPSICGRVCPQEDQCEARCTLSKKFEPVGIGRLERFVADTQLWLEPAALPPEPPLPPASGFKVAVVGSGPAGLTAAGDLVRLGHRVTVFEALHKAGGVLVYGIPEFRLPKAIVEREVQALQRMGVELRTNFVIGKTETIDELLANSYDAVFVATGAGLPHFMNIPGENLNGVYSANEFLTRANLMKAYRFPEYDTPIHLGKRVAVVGAGNVAMDAARTALRLGAEKVFLVYRRSHEEMPARAEEIEHAEEEGIDLRLLTSPVRILGDKENWVTGCECIRMELGEPDASGRRRPVAVPQSEHVLPVDTVIMAIGQSPNPLVPATTPGLETTRHGTIVGDPETGKTGKRGVFVGGDILTGAATVILAMGAGRKSARAIDVWLRDPERKW
ncbi:MAG: NADPH-dependent glutamate synthase [Planctomycetes bacterium]|nr:NADPH-dependent glutamate synthase [Planctomycetota bacterium]